MVWYVWYKNDSALKMDLDLSKYRNLAEREGGAVQVPKCPGQDRRYWKPEDIFEDECPNCGNILEFWKTDIRVRCEKCRRLVSNPRFDMGCAEWCVYAEDCLGDIAKGYGKPDSFLEKIQAATEQALEAEAMGGTAMGAEVQARLQRVLSVAKKLSAERGVQLLVLAVAACFQIIKESMDKRAADKIIAELPGKAGLPRLVVEEAVQVLAELESGKLRRLPARMLHKALKLGARHEGALGKKAQEN